MQRVFAVVLFAVTVPWVLGVSYTWGFLMWAIKAAKHYRWEENGILTAEWTEWVVRPRKWLGVRKNPDGTPMKRGGQYQFRALWDYSTTIGRMIIYQPGMRRAKVTDPLTRVEKHERVHVRQIEDLMTIAFLVALATYCAKHDLWLSATVWFSGGCWQAVDFLTAAMRGEEPYRDSEHERSAYAQTDLTASGQSWLDQREKTRQASKKN